jgi:hypothetical protein
MAKKTLCIPMRKTYLLTLLREIIRIYSENYMKPTSTLYGKNAELFNVKAGGAYVHIVT